ncbi:MAG: ABC transporter permease [Anaerolineae bacterium]|nr:ABC transporter permease [Anaerolineae bacterium]MCO5188819.1 ABC transporter permease [Anaerolineae bacterium]MCO5195960.1 ABC transporter permease [Anaerolineae bacterium]MCO5199653.1 ABC transporter permease [Anaerolineae bacterium]MCO5207477.1 ABC transporter permease [Anaerolineae bacterium]
MIRLRRFLTELRRYPSALAGIIIILLLLITSIVVPIMTPYSEALRLWRGGEDIWAQYPRNAWPVWYNLFVEGTLPETIVFDSSKEDGVITEQQLSEGTREILFSYEFDYQYDDFPPEMNVFTKAKYTEKQPFVEMTWYTPDGRDIRLGEFSSGPTTSFRFAQEERLQRRLERETGIDNVAANKALFDDPSQEGLQPLKGTYRIELAGLLFEEDSELETTFVSYGLVHGIAGTDHRRRDLSVALLWGTPIAMAFGLLAAIGTTVTTMGIAAVGVWYGGWLDGLIQRITEINAIIPLLPILIMVGTFYSRSIWLMLGLVILLSIFGLSIKNYRAIFLQVRELPYIDAAKAYGAGNLRIIFRYLIPRVLPLIIPSLILLIPSFVFLEASLAVLGLGDPVLPTWGKLINDANSEGALFNGFYYWILEPAGLLMLAGFGFALVGFALDRIFNPRLREL